MTETTVWNSIADITSSEGEVRELLDLSWSEQALVMPMAKSLHVQWGLSRIDRGFIYGSSRTDETHPGLVPFEALGELEISRDLEDAVTTLRTVKSLGVSLKSQSWILGFGLVMTVIGVFIGIGATYLFSSL